MTNSKVLSWSLASFCAFTFLLCVTYGLIAPESLHLSRALEVVLPGFRWLTPGSVVLGLAEAFLYGAYAGLVFAPLYNFFCRRLGRPARDVRSGRSARVIDVDSRQRWSIDSSRTSFQRHNGRQRFPYAYCLISRLACESRQP